MKAEIRIVSLAVAGILGGWANLALALPVANQQGDYPVPPARARGNRQVNWVVVDQKFLDGTRHVIYPWNQSKISNLKS
ncbi:hypothetical protein QUA56_28925, partial [Microcoleus sp. N3A4]